MTAAIYLARFRRRLVVIDAGESRAQMERFHAPRIAAEATGLERLGSGFAVTAGRDRYEAPAVILATGALDPRTGPDGRIVTDAHQQTDVPGLYAAGDVVTGLNQIAVAMAQGEIAATAIHNAARRAEGRSISRSST